MSPGQPSNQFGQTQHVFKCDDTFGIMKTQISDVIDINNAGINLKHNNRKHGKTPTILAVNYDDSIIVKKINFY